MSRSDYPVDVRAEHPERSSRGWAALTIFWIKFLALIPHVVILVFLGIAQWVVAFVAQFVVAFKGEYPPRMHEFVTGVLRWQTRITAFLFSLNDRYPPFTLQPVDDYPVDVVTERPAQPSRVYAAFTIVVQLLGFVALVWLAVWFIDHADTIASWSTNGTTSYNYQLNLPSWGGGGLLLRSLAAIPHYFVLAFLGIAAFVLWVIVQWVILFVARFPLGMWHVVAGYVRWYTRVNAYALGLVDRYPPFTLDPSLTAKEPPEAPLPSWPAAPPAAGPSAPAWPAAPPPSPPAARPTAPPPPPATPGPTAPAPPTGIAEPPRDSPPEDPGQPQGG
jgi:hypothetical protein